MAGQMRQPRLADLVASRLRDEILSGRLKEGDSLPRQEDLLAGFNVSMPSVREAMRILETEGLISVRRGNIGGATVHLPTAQRTAYMVSLVLQARQVGLPDVGQALNNVEPICAGLCAGRPDRDTEVVPRLAEIIDVQERALDDLGTFNRAAREFHEQVVALCGNETMIVMIGALESIWSAHQSRSYQHVPLGATEADRDTLRHGVRVHRSLLAAIAAGNVAKAVTLAREHLDAAHAFMLARDEELKGVTAELLREAPAPMPLFGG